MRFTKLEMQNFMCYGEQQEVVLARRGLVGVIGLNKDAKQADSNGAGKSAIVEAIGWCLWGKTIREVEKVTNKKAKKDCVVSLYIEDDGKIYKVTRTQGGSKKKANDILVEIDGVPATAGTNKDTQALIDIILGMDFQTFTQSVLLTYRGKSFCSMKDSEQKEVLENILQINSIAKAREIVRGRISSKQNQLALARAQIQGLQSKIADVEFHLEKTTKISKEQEEVKNRKLVELQAKRQNMESNVKGLLNKLNNSQIQKELGVLEREMQKLVAESHDRLKMESEAIRMVTGEKSELQKKIAIAEDRIVGLQETAQQLSGMACKECPQCFQPITVDYVESSLSVYDTRIKTLQNIRESVIEQCQILESKENQLLALIEQNQQAFSLKRTRLVDKQQALLVTLRECESNRQMANQYVELIRDVDNEIKSLDKATDPYENMIKELEGMFKKCKEDMQLTQLNADKLDHEVRHLLFWDHGFSNKGLKSFIIENAIPFLNERVQYYADILSGGDLLIEFSAQTQLKSGEMREQLKINVTNQQGSEVYEGNSDGEKRRSDVAVGWSLGDLAASRSRKSINFKCLDEPFENLDESGEDAMLRLLHTELPRYETIFVMTHNSDFQDQLPGCLRVVKHKGFSYIEGDNADEYKRQGAAD